MMLSEQISKCFSVFFTFVLWGFDYSYRLHRYSSDIVIVRMNAPYRLAKCSNCYPRGQTTNMQIPKGLNASTPGPFPHDTQSCFPSYPDRKYMTASDMPKCFKRWICAAFASAESKISAARSNDSSSSLRLTIS
jgi:hypothetical protein